MLSRLLNTPQNCTSAGILGILKWQTLSRRRRRRRRSLYVLWPVGITAGKSVASLIFFLFSLSRNIRTFCFSVSAAAPGGPGSKPRWTWLRGRSQHRRARNCPPTSWSNDSHSEASCLTQTSLSLLKNKWGDGRYLQSRLQSNFFFRSFPLIHHRPDVGACNALLPLLLSLLLWQSTSEGWRERWNKTDSTLFLSLSFQRCESHCLPASAGTGSVRPILLSPAVVDMHSTNTILWGREREREKPAGEVMLNAKSQSGTRDVKKKIVLKRWRPDSSPLPPYTHTHTPGHARSRPQSVTVRPHSSLSDRLLDPQDRAEETTREHHLRFDIGPPSPSPLPLTTPPKQTSCLHELCLVAGWLLES